MEKSGDVPPPYSPGYGYNYNQPPPPGYTSQYPNHVVVTQPIRVAVPNTPPPDRMAAAIIVTLFCFWPTGLVAILRESEAQSAYRSGDFARAHAASHGANTMIKASVIVGLCVLASLVIFVGVYVGYVINVVDNYDT